MKADDPTTLTARLVGLIPGAEDVRVTGVASLGAQRRTLFVEVIAKDRIDRAVVQIAANPAETAIVENEVRLLRAAEKAGVAVPHILAEDLATGTVVSTHVEGESIPRRILRLVEADSKLGGRLTADCARALALIHRIPTADFRDLRDLADPDRYASEMETLLETLTTPHPTFRLGIRWLRRRRPPTVARPAIVHGDFRLGNFLANEGGITAVLDWELVHLGDPMEDLAWLCLRTWRFDADELEVGGFGKQVELRTAYESAGGEWREEAFRWWTVARTLWWGLGLARQVQAVLNGDATSIVLAASGRRVVELEYDLLRLMED